MKKTMPDFKIILQGYFKSREMSCNTIDEIAGKKLHVVRFRDLLALIHDKYTQIIVNAVRLHMC